MNLQVLKTGDNSHTLYVPELDETYHSRNGALQESRYVFIDKGLREIAKHKKEIRLLEVGLGTGLNAILTLEESGLLGMQVHYNSLETNPLPLEMIRELHYEHLLGSAIQPVFEHLHALSWNSTHRINDGFSLCKFARSLIGFESAHLYDLIYFDAFAPDKQPELWTLSVFEQLFSQMTEGAVLVTYSAKGEVKRNLRAAGFQVERLPGPPRKRHMLRATKPLRPTGE